MSTSRPLRLFLGVGFLLFLSVANTSAQSNSANSKESLSPQAACDYIADWVRTWDRKHPAIDPTDSRSSRKVTTNTNSNSYTTYADGTTLGGRITKTDVDDLAQAASPLGLTNLIAVAVAFDQSNYYGDLRYLLDGALRQSLNTMAKDSDLPLLLKSAPNTRFLLGYICQRSGWTTDPQFIAFVQNELAKASGNAIPLTALDQARSITFGPSTRPSNRRGDDDSPDASRYYLENLCKVARYTESPELATELDGVLKRVSQNGDQYPYTTVRSLLDFALDTNESTVGIPYVPDLLTALVSRQNHSDLDKDRFSLINSLYYNLADRKVSKVCGDPKVQEAIRQIASSSARDRDQYAAFWANGCLALIGDRASLRMIVHDCIDSAANKTQDTYFFSSSGTTILRTIIYQGPQDKAKSVLEYLDKCQFDATKGRWTLVVPGFEDKSNDDTPDPVRVRTNSSGTRYLYLR